MIISDKNRYIFIAVPKTGTTSIQKLLLKYDSTAKKNAIKIKGKSFKFGEHDTAIQIKRELGEEYSKFRTFGFIRNPYSRIVSSYFFYKNGKPIASGNKKPWPPRIRMAYAKSCPFKLWALSYPYKSNIEYFVNQNGEVIIDYIGTFERLRDDLLNIFKTIGLDISVENLKHRNKSSHFAYSEYFDNKMFRSLIDKRIKRDLDFYETHQHN